MKKTIQVSVAEITADLRHGLSDAELMKKYGLSEKGLKRVFDSLLRAACNAPVDLNPRNSFRKGRRFWLGKKSRNLAFRQTCKGPMKTRPRIHSWLTTASLLKGIPDNSRKKKAAFTEPEPH